MDTQISQSANHKIWRFIGAQLVHTTFTIIILAGLLFGATRVGALNGLLAPLAQTTGSSFTTINYQGRLADSSGAPIDNTNPGVGMTFALYDVETSGSPLWSETHAAVRVNEGLFSVKLGSVNALSASLLSGDRWLGIRVGADAEMTPREKLAAVPYAMIAGEALTVADESVTSSKMAPSWYEDFNPVTISTTSTEPQATGVEVTFTCDVDCTALVLHRTLVQHSAADGRVNVGIYANGADVTLELGVVNQAVGSDGQFESVQSFDFVELPAGTHTIEVKFACGTPGTCYYYGDAYGQWEHLNVLMFAQP